MKYYLLAIILLLALSVKAQFPKNSFLAYTNHHPVQVNTSGLNMIANDDIQDSYISDNVSSLCVNETDGHVFISWSVCGDTSKSIFIITKISSGKSNDSSFVDYTYNIYNSFDRPLLYCIKDKEPIKDTTFYNLYKLYNTGELKLIVTVFIPIMDNQENNSVNNFIIKHKNKKSNE